METFLQKLAASNNLPAKPADVLRAQWQLRYGSPIVDADWEPIVRATKKKGLSAKGRAAIAAGGAAALLGGAGLATALNRRKKTTEKVAEEDTSMDKVAEYKEEIYKAAAEEAAAPREKLRSRWFYNLDPKYIREEDLSPEYYEAAQKQRKINKQIGLASLGGGALGVGLAGVGSARMAKGKSGAQAMMLAGIAAPAAAQIAAAIPNSKKRREVVNQLLNTPAKNQSEENFRASMLNLPRSVSGGKKLLKD